MTATLIAAIPPQSYTDPTLPLHVQATVNDGQRIAYGCASGVVLRCLPDQVSFKVKPVETFLGTKKPILTAAVSPNGRAVVAGDGDGFCHVWLKAKGGIEFVSYKLDGLRYVKMVDIAISPDSRRLAICGIDKYSKRLAAAVLIDGGIAIGKIEGHSKGICGVTFSPFKPYNIVTGGFDGYLCLHEGPPFKVKKSVLAHENGKIYSTRFSPCGQVVAACGDRGWIGLFDALTLTLIRQCVVDGQPQLLSLSWSPSSNGFALVSDDYKLRIFDRSSLTGLESVNLQLGKDEAPKGVGWSQTNWIVVPCASGHIKGWHVSNIEEKGKAANGIKNREAETRQIEALLADEMQKRSEGIVDGAIDETCPEEGTPFVQGLAIGHIDQEPSFIWYGPKGNPTAIGFDGAHGNIVIGTSSGYLMFLSTTQTVPLCFQVSRLEREVTVKSCIISERCAVAVTSDGGLRFYKVRVTNLKSGDVRHRIRETLEINSTGGGHKRATVYESATRKELIQVACAQVDKTPMRLVFVDDDQHVGLLCTCGTLYIYPTNKALLQSDPSMNISPAWSVALMGKPMAVTISGDGSLLAVALWPGPDYPASKYNLREAFARHKRSGRVKGRAIPQCVFSGLVSPKVVTSLTPSTQVTNCATSNSSHVDQPDPFWVKQIDSNQPSPISDWDPLTSSSANLHTPQTDVSTPFEYNDDDIFIDDPQIPLIEIYEISHAKSLDGFRFICCLDNHSQEISSLALNKDGSLLASVDLKRDIRVTEIESRKEIVSTYWNYHSTRVSGLDWSPDGSKLVSASTSEVYVWDVDKSHSSISIKDPQTGIIQFVRFIFNNIIMSAGSDGVMKVYELDYE